MKKINFLFLLLIASISGCDFKAPQLANDPPSSKFSFGFKGRLEKLEDAFYTSKFNYKELDYSTKWQKEPAYSFTVNRADTILNYVVTLQDCQSMYYLVKWSDDWKCDSSYIHIDRYSSNKDSISEGTAKAIFQEEIIQPLNRNFSSLTTEYHWIVEKKKDTSYVRILGQDNSLRKLHVFSMDTIGNSIAEKEIFNYLGDSTIHYRYSQSQRFMYLESKQVTKSSGH